MAVTPSDADFVQRTYRSVAVVAGFVVFVLASYGQFGAIAPFLAGVLFGVLLLYAMEVFVRRTFSTERAMDARKQKTTTIVSGRAVIAFALVKYPLIALILWAVTRLWDLPQVMIFVCGFALIHMIIGLRAMGRYLVDQMNEKTAPPRGAGVTRKE